VDLPERVGLCRDTAPLELGADRIERRPFVVRRGRS